MLITVNIEIYSVNARSELSLPCGVVDRMCHCLVSGVSVTHWSCIFWQKIEYRDIVLRFCPRVYFVGTTFVQKPGNRYSAVVQLPVVHRCCPKLSYFGTRMSKTPCVGTYLLSKNQIISIYMLSKNQVLSCCPSGSYIFVYILSKTQLFWYSNAQEPFALVFACFPNALCVRMW